MELHGSTRPTEAKLPQLATAWTPRRPSQTSRAETNLQIHALVEMASEASAGPQPLTDRYHPHNRRYAQLKISAPADVHEQLS